MSTTPDQISPATIAAVASLVGVALGAGLSLLREVLVLRRKEKKDAAHLVALVVGALERFSDGCDAVAHDDGEYDGDPNREEELLPQVKTPLFEPDKLLVEWRALPSDLLFDVLNLPYSIEAAERSIDFAEMDYDPPDHPGYFRQRKYEYAVLGIRAAHLAAQLRDHTGIAARKQKNPDRNPVEEMTAVKARIEKHWDTPNFLPDGLAPPPVQAEP